MVSGFVTSPEDQSRICFEDARPMRIASKSLMSITWLSTPLSIVRSENSFLYLDVGEIRVDRLGLRVAFHLVEVAQRLVGRDGQLAGLVDPLLALLDLLGRRLTADRPQRAGRQVDP